MEDIKKGYNDIKAYKSVGFLTILCMLIGSISLFVCIFFIMLTVRVSLLYLIGVIPTGVFGLWSTGMYFRKETYPDLALMQKDDFLYLFPDTKRQIILPLTDIVEVRKKNSNYLAWGRGAAGQLIITTKTNYYSLNIRDLNIIYKSLDENLKRFTHQSNNI